ncbi:MAG: DNA repair protein RecN [Bacteroidales bacterium]|nr:DNA repair protein RecN [Bacteroidales bacterium]
MLHRLHIENYVLIEGIDLDFAPGFSVITGETGAGKSVLLEAVGLVLGQRADLKMIKEGRERCLIEAEFTEISSLEAFFTEQDLLYDPLSCVIRRELYANGKSRAFVNDSPVTLSQLRELGNRLVDIHSQHENLLLGKESFQLDLLDTVAGTAPEKEAYRLAWEDYRSKAMEVDRLAEELRKGQEERDYLSFQFRQLDQARLQAGEQAGLEQELDVLSHTEEIKSGLARLKDYFDGEDDGLCVRLKSASQTARHLAEVFPAAGEAGQRLEATLIEIKDLSRDIERWDASVELNPHRMQQVEERLGQLFDLQQRHHVRSEEELLALKADYETRLQLIDTGDQVLQQGREAMEAARREAEKAAAALSAKRASVRESVEQYMVTQLQQLGMPHARFLVGQQPKEMDASGADKVTFLFSANKNAAVQPIAQIASGGEISRLMLCLKALVADTGQGSVLLLDEIDTGVSGEIAHKMALLMQEIARNRQVLCITHLPQIAAKGARHYKVEKSDTEEQSLSSARLLSESERISEIALMLSGAALGEAALKNARELIYGE